MDPITLALAGMAAVQKTVSMIKEASSTIDDVRSLGPLLGRYFEQKHEVTKALNQAKSSGGSNMGKAIQIELDLKAQRDFEEQVKGLFFPNNMDVWNSIMARVAEMNKQDKIDMQLARDRALRAKKEREELVEIVIVVGGVILIFLLVGFGVYIVMDARSA
jgi:preprotein translocase subunit Sss1